MKFKYILSLLLLTAGITATFNSQAFFGWGNRCYSCPSAYSYSAYNYYPANYSYSYYPGYTYIV